MGHDTTASAFIAHDVSERMRSAADTIENLRDGLQKEGDALRDYRASQIAAEAERRLRESYGQVPEQGERENDGERESYGEVCSDDRSELIVRCWHMGWLDDDSRYYELFGTPESAARTIEHICQFTHGGELCDRCQAYLFDSCDRTLRLGSEQKIYDALLEWLRGKDEVIDEPDTIRNELIDDGLLKDDAE